MENLSELDDVKRRLCELVTEDKISDAKNRYGNISMEVLVRALAIDVALSGGDLQETCPLELLKDHDELKEKTKELEDVVKKQGKEIAELQRELRESDLKVDKLFTRTEDVARAVKAAHGEKSLRKRKE
jgi:hypothetical protein